MNTPCPQRAAGFTLIEMIMVIVITGIIAATIGQLVGGQMAGYQDLSERAALVQLAQTAIRRIERDIHRGLPNSTRVSASSVEVLNALDGGRYRASARIDPLHLGPPTLTIASATNNVGTPIVITTTTNHSLAQNDRLSVPLLDSSADPHWLVDSVLSLTSVRLKRLDGNASSGTGVNLVGGVARKITFYITSAVNTPGSLIQITTNPAHNLAIGDHVSVPLLWSSANPYWRVRTVDSPTAVTLERYNGNDSSGDGTSLEDAQIQRLLGNPLVTTNLPVDADAHTPLGVGAILCDEKDRVKRFDLIGNFNPTALPLPTNPCTNAPANLWAVVKNTGTGLQNAYQGPNVDSNVALVTRYCQPTAGNTDYQLEVNNTRLDNSQCPFPDFSSSQRIYLVDTPVSFVCAGNRLTRYSGYTPSVAGPPTAAAPPAGGASAVLVNQADCARTSAVLTPGGGSIPALLTVTLTLCSDLAAGCPPNESIAITQQITIENEI